MPDPYFVSRPDGFHPNPRAHGPWALDMLHGRLLGGLLARQLEIGHLPDGWRMARLTIDLFRPGAMAPVEIEVSPVREGRRLRLVDATAVCDGHRIGRLTGLMLPESTDPPGAIWRPEPSNWPDPETVADTRPDTDDEAVLGWLFRTVDGGFGTGSRSRVWTNDTICLVDDEPMSPLVRTAVSGDIACPMANSSDEGLHYINADYTMLIGRYPRGPWVGVEVAQQIQADGVSVASATLYDLDGPFATSGGTSLARPPLDAESG